MLNKSLRQAAPTSENKLFGVGIKNLVTFWVKLKYDLDVLLLSGQLETSSLNIS